MARSNSPNERNAFICGTCSKGYSRRDYLERHELNHNSPSCICPACGKSFARPDVLRKHLSTSCKLRRGSDGENAPLTSAEEDAIIPRKRRRTKVRAAEAASPTPSSSSVSAASSSPSEERTRRVPASSSSASAASTKVATPASPGSAGSPRSEPAADERMNAHYARLRSLQAEPRFLAATDARPGPARAAAAPARAGARLDVPLAPAFAATPEAFPDLAFPGLSALSTLAPAAPSVSAKPEPLAASTQPASTAEAAWASTSANDDLLSWLFSVTSTVPPSSLSSAAAPPPVPSSASSSGSVGSVDAWPVTPSGGARKLSDASDAAELASLPDLPDLSYGGFGAGLGSSLSGTLGGGLGSLSGGGLDLDLSSLPGGLAGLRGLPGMPEFGDKGTDWLAPKPAPSAPKYDPYAYDQGTMAQMRLYYELYFKA